MRKKVSDLECLFSKRVRELRIEKGMKQKDLANYLKGFSSHAISEWETRGKEPSFTVLMELALLFGVSTDYLLGLEDL